LCKKRFDILKKEYELRQFEDSSGDSADDTKPAAIYKKHLLKLDELIKD
jgi:hypothetical protein